MPEPGVSTAKRAARTVLAFDFGLKRIGVAVGEAELGTAHPLPAIGRFSQVEQLVEEWRPAALVVGLPTSVQGEAHAMTRRAQEFARRLEKRFKLPVARVDERFTSVEATSRLRGARGGKGGARKSQIDSVAAQVILEQYFDQAA